MDWQTWFVFRKKHSKSSNVSYCVLPILNVYTYEYASIICQSKVALHLVESVVNVLNLEVSVCFQVTEDVFR
jgi:hypothetical protein